MTTIKMINEIKSAIEDWTDGDNIKAQDIEELADFIAIRLTAAGKVDDLGRRLPDPV